MAGAPGRLLTSGRAADVYDLGDGTVLRRYRTAHDCTGEARLMIWLRSEGVPVPAVHRADGRDIVMDRIDGPTMLDDLAGRPWRFVGHARRLARLQRDLNGLVAHDWVPVHDGVLDGDRVLHLDLHPMNVILGPDGPVIIDWTNASRGDPAFDAAMTYVVIATFEATGWVERVGQRMVVATFEWTRGRSLVRRGLPDAIRYRLGDRNVTPGERVNLQRLLERSTSGFRSRATRR